MNNAIVYLDFLQKVGDYRNFPVESDYRECFVIRLKGPLYRGLKISDKSVDELVAFHKKCTHLGWNLSPTQGNDIFHILGPCPGHLTSFDLSKGGMVVIGQATECLPQVRLEFVDINGKGAIMAKGLYSCVNSVPYGLPYGHQTYTANTDDHE